MSRTFKDAAKAMTQPPMDRMVKRVRVGKCWLTKKEGFTTQEAALTRAGELNVGIEWRAYRCSYCGNYHLTSKE